MFVEAGVAGGFNENDLRQRAIFQVGEILRDGGNLVRPICWNGLSPGKKLNVTEPHQARAVVRRSGAWAMGWVNVDSPADAFALQLLEDGRGGEVLAVPAVSTHFVHISLRGCSIEVFTVGMGSRHDRVKPAIRRGEVRCHEVVVVQIFAGVVAHGAFAVNVKVGRAEQTWHHGRRCGRIRSSWPDAVPRGSLTSQSRWASFHEGLVFSVHSVSSSKEATAGLLAFILQSLGGGNAGSQPGTVGGGP